jgi:hypothetical protein
MSSRLAAILLGLAMLATACGSTEVSTTADDRPTPPSTTSTTTVAAITTPEAEAWDLVVLGDSFANTLGWPTQLADLIASDFGVATSVDGDVCFGGCTSLTRIRSSETLQDLIADAEVIVLQPQPGRVITPLRRSYFDGECGGTDGLECFRQAEDEFRGYVEELFDEVIALSQPGAIIRTTQATGTWAIDAFHRGLRDTDPDTFDAFLENMLDLSEHIAEAAADRCILVVDVNAIMSGADYRQPVNPNYSDHGSHPSQEGSRIIAEALHDLGYEATVGGC